MKTFVAFVAAATLSAASFAGPVQEGKQLRTGPVPMSETQMDRVTAGGLIDVTVVNVANNNQVAVAIPVNAAVAIAVLGGAVAGAAQKPGNITQGR